MPRSRPQPPQQVFEELVLALEAAAEIAEITLGSGSRKAVGHAMLCLIDRARALTTAWRAASEGKK